MSPTDYSNPDWLCIHRVVNHQCVQCFPGKRKPTDDAKKMAEQFCSCTGFPIGEHGPHCYATRVARILDDFAAKQVQKALKRLE